MEKYISVSEFTHNLKGVIEQSFHRVFLRGEISSLARPGSGHYYFTLKDQRSQISAVIFKSSVRKISFPFENGLEVLVFGRVSIYEPRGTYQIIIENVLPVGEGLLQLQFDQLKSKLLEEGLFEDEQKKQLPYLPTKIGIVTSPTGAAIQDFLKVLESRYTQSEIIIYPSLVQGKVAAEQIKAGIEYFNTQEKVDIIVITRGGGSLEDLWAFNEEILARSIYKSEIPIISAVGHEIDFTIADFVSDFRAATPSAAAEVILPLNHQLKEELNYFDESLERLISSKIEKKQETLKNFAKRIRSPKDVIYTYIKRVDDTFIRLQEGFFKNKNKCKHSYQNLNTQLNFHSPISKIKNYQERIDTLKNNLTKDLFHKFEIYKKSIEKNIDLLESVSPLSTMKRGYSLTETGKGSVLKRANQIQHGDQIQIKFIDGKVKATVSETILKIQTGNN